jgi:spermidine/putrescine transport system permease protein
MKTMFSRWRWAYKALDLTVFTFVLVFFYIPIIILMIYSFNDSKIITGWKGFTFKYYLDLLTNTEIKLAFRNTMLIALLSTVISTTLGVLTALGLENKRFTGSKLVSGMLFLPLIMPDILMGVSLALLYNFMQIRTGMVTVLIAHITFCLSYTVIVVRSRLEGFDNSLMEAAMDLGANSWQSFFKVKLPIMMPGVVASMLLAFTLSIDDFIITFFTTGRGFNTLPIYVEGAIRRGIMTHINALSTLMIGLTIILVSFSQRFYRYFIGKM